MKVTDITPKEFQCVSLACPAILSINDGKNIVIVGKKVDPSNLGIAERVGKDEAVILVDPAMIKQLQL